MDRDSKTHRQLLASQKVFYDERAEHYADPSKPSDRLGRGFVPEDLMTALVDEFAPSGDVLELACGTGLCTEHLVRHATTLTAVDASPRMIRLARDRVGDPRVKYVLSDIFSFEPDRSFDTIFFGFWLSHVPPGAFEEFWAIVRRCLAPTGRVGFIDEDDRGAVHDDVRDVDGVPVARRKLADGREFDVVKIFWHPVDLEERLRAVGWHVSVRPVGETFLFGTGGPE